MTLLIWKQPVPVEVSATTRRGSVLVLQVMLGLLVKEQNAKMTAVVEGHVFQCGIMQISTAIMSHCNIRIISGMQTNFMAASVT